MNSLNKLIAPLLMGVSMVSSVFAADSASEGSLNSMPENELRMHTLQPLSEDLYPVPKDLQSKIIEYILNDAKRELFDEPLVQTTLQGHTGWVTSAVWSADEKRVLSAGSDGTIKIWNLSTGKAVQTLQGHTGWVNSAVWSADEKRVLSAGDDRTIKIWNLSTGEAVQTLQGHTGCVNSAVWSADEQQVLSASGDGTIKIWTLPIS